MIYPKSILIVACCLIVNIKNAAMTVAAAASEDELLLQQQSLPSALLRSPAIMSRGETSRQPLVQRVRKRRLGKDDDDDKNGGEGNDDEEDRRTKNPTTRNPTMSPWIAVPSTRFPVVAPTEAPVIAPTEAPVMSPTKAPVMAPTKVPVMAPVQEPPAPTPTGYPILLVPSPTGAPFQFLPANEPEAPQPMIATTVPPTFNNQRETRSVALNAFAVSVAATGLDDTLDERAVRVVYQDDIRKATQTYLRDYLSYENLLYVQLRSSSRRNLLDLSETFRYEGDAVFDTTKVLPDRDEILSRQASALEDASTYQAFLSTMPTLQNVELVEAKFQSNVLADEANETSNPLIVIIVAAVVALVVLVCLVVLIRRLCCLGRKRLPPPPPKNEYEEEEEENQGTHASWTDDEKQSVEQIPNLSSSTTGETAAPSSDAEESAPPIKKKKTALQFQVPRKTLNPQLYSVPVIDRADSADSMDGYSLGSKKIMAQPPEPPVPEYTSDTESQFSYDNIPGTNIPRVLGRTLSADSLETTDDELVVPPAPSVKKINRVVEERDPLSGMGMEDDTGSLPFDESIEDSMEQDLDIFSAELEKIKRDIATQRVQGQS